MKRQGQAGFTLIELVMVIVILGILAAFALPRFADLGTEARKASLNGAIGAVKSATSIARADALVNNQTGATGTVTLEGATINMIFGYPAAASIASAAQLTDYTIAVSAATPPVATISIQTDCSFTYTEAAGTAIPASTSVATVSGC